MTLGAVMKGVPVERWLGPGDVRVESLSYHSGRVRPGALFFAWQGAKSDGHAHVPAALAGGARAVVLERELEGLACPQVVVRSARRALSRAAANFYGHPGRQLAVVGITGTNGKTSTAFLVRHLLDRCGWKCGLTGTVHHDVGTGPVPSERTTPEGLEIQHYLADMVRNGCRAAAMEVSSHALEQGRVEGLPFRVAVFTNLTQDHLDYHGTMEAYFEAKSRLFLSLEPGSVAVLPEEDEWGVRLRGLIPDGVTVWTYGYGPGASLRATAAEFRETGTTFELETGGECCPARVPWIGAFNLSNVLAALTVGRALGVETAGLVRALAEAPSVPGRMERVPGSGPFTVLVDYAHTDDAVRKVLNVLRPLTRGRLAVVIGCGGDRDAGKRPLMARAACETADRVYFTSDNPRSEDPRAILDAMVAGVPERKNFCVEPDRRAAIRRALAEAGPGDVVVLAGKGHEAFQEVGGMRHPFSDLDEAAAVLRGQGGVS
jgi:UDP-N-acetylmuramoyl-L-alanyl-D-glutamate--2,6-diaminopimelate ligase